MKYRISLLALMVGTLCACGNNTPKSSESASSQDTPPQATTQNPNKIAEVVIVNGSEPESLDPKRLRTPALLISIAKCLWV